MQPDEVAVGTERFGQPRHVDVGQPLLVEAQLGKVFGEEVPSDLRHLLPSADPFPTLGAQAGLHHE